MYIGHKCEDGKVQKLSDHLNGVADLAEVFAEEYGAGEHAHRTGLMHDLGKYGAKAQRRQEDPEHVAKTDHSTAGTKEAVKLGDAIAAFAIAGHHGGLMNSGSKMASIAHDGTLWGRLKAQIDEDYYVYKREIELKPGVYPPKWLRGDDFAASFYTRMLFSCLVDADFLDTEAFMADEAAPRGNKTTMEEMLEKLTNYISPWFPAQGSINQRRCEILQYCLNGGTFPRGLFTLTVPTGGGKTVSSMAFALSHAAKHGLKRIIYVIPYTSIIEQNADVFAKIVGEDNVLEHHSGIEYDEGKQDALDESEMRKRLATENWDAPVVVTTAVQFFESLFASKTSKCRKLHNIANSVVIFDEAQMMPLLYLRPCVAVIAELVKHYGVTAVLCTATQPALNDLFKTYAPDIQIHEICGRVSEYFAFFRRVNFVQEGKVTNEELADRLNSEEQVLCIVNSRKRAQAVFEALQNENRFHLSTLMTPDDRRRTLDVVRDRLKQGKTCRVVATSLIEAGVDVDFPAVWREEAGLDSILQAAGRCNREGKRRAEESTVHVFEGEGGVPPMFRQQTAAMRIALETVDTMDQPEAVEAYFNALLKLRAEVLDSKDIIKGCKTCQFRDVAERFKLIEADTVTVYIPNARNQQLIDQLRRGEYGKKTIRDLQKDAINIYENQYLKLYGAGRLERTADGFVILSDAASYNEIRGLEIASDPGAALFV